MELLFCLNKRVGVALAIVVKFIKRAADDNTHSSSIEYVTTKSFIFYRHPKNSWRLNGKLLISSSSLRETIRSESIIVLFAKNKILATQLRKGIIFFCVY